MKIVTPSVEIMRTGLETEFVTPEQFIEKVGRTCYKSEDKITDDSAAKFVENLIKRGHEAVIEHYNLIFKVDYDTYDHLETCTQMLANNVNLPLSEPYRSYIRFTDFMAYDGSGVRYIVSGNMRAWRDYVKACVNAFGGVPTYMHGMIRNYHLFFPEYQDYVPAIFTNDEMIPVYVRDLYDVERRVHQAVTVKFTCDRGVSHEIVRHRPSSYAQESTRYCNYGQDKFGSEITVVRPSWCAPGDDKYDAWRTGCLAAEGAYFNLLAGGATPQEARSVLPNSLKTELVMTATRDEWNHFFKLRCPASAHPDMREVANMGAMLFEKEVYLVKDDIVVEAL